MRPADTACRRSPLHRDTRPPPAAPRPCRDPRGARPVDRAREAAPEARARPRPLGRRVGGTARPRPRRAPLRRGAARRGGRLACGARRDGLATAGRRALRGRLARQHAPARARRRCAPARPPRRGDPGRGQGEDAGRRRGRPRVTAHPRAGAVASLRGGRNRNPAAGNRSDRRRRPRGRRPHLLEVPVARRGLDRRGPAGPAGRGSLARRRVLARPPPRAGADPGAHPRSRRGRAAHARKRGYREHGGRVRAHPPRRRRLRGARCGPRAPRGRDGVRPAVRPCGGALPRGHIPRERIFFVPRRTTYEIEPMYGNTRIATTQPIVPPAE